MPLNLKRNTDKNDLKLRIKYNAISVFAKVLDAISLLNFFIDFKEFPKKKNPRKTNS